MKFALVPRPLSRFFRDRQGASLVEFGLAAPVLLTLILGLLGIGDFLWEANTLQYNVEEAVRCLNVTPSTCGSVAKVQAFLAQRSVTLPNMSLSLSATTDKDCVSASAPYTMLSLNPFSVTLQASSCRMK